MIGRLLRLSGWLELMLGTGHTVFGLRMLLWQGWTRPDVPLLRFVLVHQLALAVLIVLFVRWHVLAVAAVLGMVVALGGALVEATRASATRRSRRFA